MGVDTQTDGCTRIREARVCLGAWRTLPADQKALPWGPYIQDKGLHSMLSGVCGWNEPLNLRQGSAPPSVGHQVTYEPLTALVFKSIKWFYVLNCVPPNL